MKRDFRKPLIVMSPKSLLRHPKAISTVKELADGTFFEVIDDSSVDKKAVETLVLCSGKIYYNILDGKAALTEKKVADKVAVVRVEQLYPFPGHKLAPLLASYPNAKKIMWTQEEPKNMGAWSFIAPRLQELINEKNLKALLAYNGRTERASPATGSEKVHIAEQDEIVKMCFSTGPAGVAKSPA